MKLKMMVAVLALSSFAFAQHGGGGGRPAGAGAPMGGGASHVAQRATFVQFQLPPVDTSGAAPIWWIASDI